MITKQLLEKYKKMMPFYTNSSYSNGHIDEKSSGGLTLPCQASKLKSPKEKTNNQQKTELLPEKWPRECHGKEGEAMESRETIRSCQELTKNFKNKCYKDNSSKLQFTGVAPDKDVYNISAPFEAEGGRYIAGRVERRDSEHSQVIFFRQEGDTWAADHSIPPLALQDPFVCRIGGQLVVGGVEVFDDLDNPGHLNYRTVFLRGDSLHSLERFATGPDRMKDIRLHQLADGRILVFTRPQGAVGGRGKIGWTILDRLEDLDPAHIGKAEVLEYQFLPEEWGGANEVHPLGGTKVGVLGHIARFDEAGNRHYHAAAFVFDWSDGSYTPMQIIAMRCNFQDGPSKRPDLEDVIFSGGMIRHGDGTARLYCGVSDAEGHSITIPDPFTQVGKGL